MYLWLICTDFVKSIHVISKWLETWKGRGDVVKAFYNILLKNKGGYTGE